MEDDFQTRVDNLKEVIRETPYDLLQQRVYICFANGCLLLTSFLKSKGEKGWAAKLVDDSGEPMLSGKEQKVLEETFEKAPWLFTMLNSIQKQNGGAIPIPQITAAGSLAEKVPGLSSFSLTGDDVSLDRIFKKFLEFTNKMDDFWTEFQNGPGASVKMFMEGDQIVTIPMSPPIPVPVPRKPVAMLLVALIDSFRLTSALVGNQNILLTLIVFLEELATGQWRQMIMTAAGLISPAGVAIGVIGKYIINAWLLINPNLRDDLLRDVYKGGKSFMIGFLLWAASILPPQALRIPVETALGKMRELVAGLDDKIKELEEQGSAPLRSIGKQLKLGRLDLDALTKISLADIQNIQALAQWDLILCTQEFQEIIKPLEQEPIFRLIMELLSIPTLAEDKYKICGAEPYPSVADRVKEVMTPEIIDAEPEQTGGKQKQKQKQKRRSRSKRRSRKNK